MRMESEDVLVVIRCVTGVGWLEDIVTLEGSLICAWRKRILMLSATHVTLLPDLEETLLLSREQMTNMTRI